MTDAYIPKEQIVIKGCTAKNLHPNLQAKDFQHTTRILILKYVLIDFAGPNM